MEQTVKRTARVALSAQGSDHVARRGRVAATRRSRPHHLLAIVLLLIPPAVHAHTFTTLYSFAEAGDGGFPTNTLTETAPGVFVGTATSTIFQITSAGVFKTLSTFAPEAGGATTGQLYPASNGLLYGANDSGNGSVTGSIYIAKSSGQVKVLRTNPYYASPLIEASDGNLYGVAASAAGQDFMIFRMTQSGVETPLYSLGPSGRVNS